MCKRLSNRKQRKETRDDFSRALVTSPHANNKPRTNRRSIKRRNISGNKNKLGAMDIRRVVGYR